MKIYINNVSMPFEVLPVSTPTLDETLETLSFALVVNDIARPFAPMQDVRLELENDTNDVVNLVLSTDTVELFSLKPLKYKHSISCVQNTRTLSKHIVRNSVFSQPANDVRKSFNAQSAGMQSNRNPQNDSIILNNSMIDSNNRNQASSPLTLSANEKIKKCRLKLSFQCMIGNVASTATKDWNWKMKNFRELSNSVNMTSLEQVGYLELHYKDADGVAQTPEMIRPRDLSENNTFELNAEYDFPRIKELADQGYNSFEIKTYDNNFFIIASINGDDFVQNDKMLICWAWQVELIADVYYYTAFDILHLLQLRQLKRYNEEIETPLFGLPSEGELHDLLVNTIAPNFTFTESNMYECVADVFRLFDAIFTMDENHTLGIEYFNERNQEPLSNPKFAGKSMGVGEEKRTNGLVAYYQNAITKEQFPNNNSFAKLRSEKLGVPEQTDHVFIVPHPIQYVEEVITQPLRTTINFGGAGVNFTSNSPFPVDISRYVVEESIWSVLDGGPTSENDLTNGYKVRQANSVTYQSGGKVIKVAEFIEGYDERYIFTFKTAVENALCRMLGVMPVGTAHPSTNVLINKPDRDDWKDVYMRVKYNAIIDGRTQLESINNKWDKGGTTLVDQYNGAVDLNKMGLNLLGLSLKLGEPTLNATQKITKWENRIKTGDFFTYEGKIWVANVCSYTLMPRGYIQGKISFVKDYNALALRTQLLRQKRFSNISGELVTKSEENIIEYVYFTTSYDVLNSYTFGSSGTTWRLAAAFYNYLYLSFTTDDSLPNYKNAIGVLTDNEDRQIYIPCVRYGAGNMICFEFSFEHPLNAGNQSTVDTHESFIPLFSYDEYFTNITRYTDENGFLEKTTIELINIDDDYALQDEFPVMDVGTSEVFFSINDFYCYKQPNEIFALNYELAFIPLDKEDSFLGSAFINDNFFIDCKQKPRKLYLYYGTDDFKYSILDTKGHMSTGLNPVAITSVEYDPLGRGVIFNYDYLTVNFKNWAICNENGEILVASNHPRGEGSEVVCYFKLQKRRLGEADDNGYKLI